jgi:zinc resistance-associated protein
MKRIAITLALVAGIGIFAAGTGFAWRGGGGYGPGSCPGWGGGYAAQTDNTKYQKFLDETAPIRKELAADRAELNALMSTANPDPARVRALTEEIVDARTELQSKAREHNIAGRGYGPGRDGGRGWGHGPGYGRGMHRW